MRKIIAMYSNATKTTHVTRKLAVGAIWAAASALSVLSACSSQSGAGWTSGKANGSLATPTLATIDGKEAKYSSEVQLSPSHPEAGQNAVLHVAIRDDLGRAITELTRSHEKPLHLMIVSRDLDRFAHVHPILDGDRFRVEHRFEQGGEYILIVDYQQPGRGQVADQHRLHVRGPTLGPVPLSESPRQRRTNGLELTLHSERELRAGETATLHFDAVDVKTGTPAADLEPYLGARAHFVALSADGEDFVHVHALDAGPPSRVSAHAVFPRPGLYKLWAQLQRRGGVVTVPFVIRLGSPHADVDPNPTASPSDERHQHTH